MARSNPKPTQKPNWVPDDASNIVDPSAGRKTSGWLFNVKPPAENFNWFWNLISRFTDYFGAQVENWIVISSDADEQDYATLTAYLADAPAAGDRVLVKEDQTVTAQTVIPSGVDLKFLNGADLLCATNIATSVLKFSGDNHIEGVLSIVLSQTGTTAKAVEYDGDNVTGKINVENSSTGTLTTGHHINANKTGNQVTGLIDNTGGGALTNVRVDNSTEDSNALTIINGVTNKPVRTAGSYIFEEWGSRIEGDLLGVENGVPTWQRPVRSFALQIGNDLNIAGIGLPALAALNSTRVAFIDDTNNDLRTYDFDGTDWAQVGNDLNIAGVGVPKLAALSSTRVAFIDGTNEDLRTYDFDGTDWAQVGNDLNIAGIGAPTLAALSSTRVAFIDETNEDLRTYEFDGTDWAQVGNDLNIAGVVSSPSLAALSSTRVAFVTDGAPEELRTYDFDGTDWAQVGNDFTIAGIGITGLAALNSTDVVFIDSTLEKLRVYRFDGTDWAQVGNDLNIAGIGTPALAALNNTGVAFIDATLEDLRFYRWL